VTHPSADVRPWLAGRADEMADLLQRLVAVDTTNPPGRGLGRCGRLLHEAMRRLDLDPELIELGSRGGLEEPCVVRGGVGAGSRIVYFHGHFDVVPAQSPRQFDPQRRDGKIIGRGTADMKGGLVSMLYGAVAARELGLLEEDARIVFHLVCDEETGSVAGSGHLRDAGLIDPGAVAMVTAEPTGGVVWHANRGAITLRVSVAGREAHVGQVHLGDNAFENMIKIASPLAALSRELLQKRTAFPMDGDDARGSMLVVGGSTGAGANFNVVPGSAWFSVDRRFNPEEDLAEELARLADTINAAAAEAGAEASIEVLQEQRSSSTPERHPAAMALASCVERVAGRAPRFEMCPGVLETRWYAQLGIPAFAYGPGRLDVSHGPDEFIDEAAMRRCAEVYARFPQAVLR
jgi:succinyl-diaminopimelate desuccinylase